MNSKVQVSSEVIFKYGRFVDQPFLIICLVNSKGLNVKFSTTAKSASFREKSCRVYLTKCRITSADSSCNQNTPKDKANRARNQKIVIDANFHMVTFWSFDSIDRKRNKKVGCDSAPVAVLAALSNDTNPAKND